MSRHIFKKDNISIHMGWDKPLQNFYCQMYDLSIEEGTEDWLESKDLIYSEMDDRTYHDLLGRDGSPTEQLSFLTYRVKSYAKCSIPEEMLSALVDDWKNNRVNQPEKHYKAA